MGDNTERLTAAQYREEVWGVDPKAAGKKAPKYGNEKTWACPKCGSGAVIKDKADDKKFIAVCCDIQAVQLDSKWEARRFAELKQLEKYGYVRDLKIQVPIQIVFDGRPVTYPNARKITYWVDFDYHLREKGGDQWIRVLEDTKGFDTDVSKIKRALVFHMLGIRVRTNFKSGKPGPG